MVEVEIDFGKIFRAWWRRGWAILLAAMIVGCGCAVGAKLWLMPWYTSTAVFFVSGPIPTPVDSAIVVLETRQTRREILLQSGINRTEGEIEEWIHGEAVRTTDFLKVEITAPDAVEAKILADGVASVLPRRVSQIMGNVSVQVVDGADFAEKPDGFTTKQWAMLGAVIGAALSAAVIGLREIFMGEKKQTAGKTERAMIK